MQQSRGRHQPETKSQQAAFREAAHDVIFKGQTFVGQSRDCCISWCTQHHTHRSTNASCICILPWRQKRGFITWPAKCRCKARSAFLQTCVWHHLRPPNLLRHTDRKLSWVTVSKTRAKIKPNMRQTKLNICQNLMDTCRRKKHFKVSGSSQI